MFPCFFKKCRKNEDLSEFVFKPFHEIYPWITYTLTLGLLYPNPATEKRRLALILTLLVLSLPVMTMILIDIQSCWTRRDMFNIIRHSTIVGPLAGAFFKMFLMFHKRVQAKALIDEMNRDYARYSRLSRPHRELAAACIRAAVVRTEQAWPGLVTLVIMMFPGMAVISTLYSHIFDDIPKRYMVHEVNLPFREPEARFESPYYEILFVSMFGCAVICVLNYTAYDALFGLTTNHACLKMTMYCLQLKDAFKLEDPDEMYKAVIGFILEQKRAYRFGALIQDTFNIWLGTILISTMIQIGSLLFHISAGYGFDPRYTLFSITSVVHIFLPCKNAANLTAMSSETAVLVYCSGWHHSNSRKIMRMMPFLVARAQVPIRIMAFDMFQYDMELFVNILRTSYSMFTLLRS